MKQASAATPTAQAALECDDGGVIQLQVGRWKGGECPEEAKVLRLATSPVIDVGCGPGRHVLALARGGIMALGVDVSRQALALARARGASVLERSIFDRIPASGRWGSALLLDGNIGIGGNPEALLTRLKQLLRPGGRVLVEIEPPGAPMRLMKVRVVRGDVKSAWFPWASIGPDDIRSIAHAAGFETTELWTERMRWFACLAAA